jgi:large subunit ribosomal protein L16
MKGVATKGNTITYGSYGLIALDRGWITSNQIESARIAMTRSIKRGGKVFIKIFPHKSVTKKPAEVRMGSGKGAPEFWVAVVKPGRVMFEIEGVTEAQAKEAMRLAAHKLPVKCRFALKGEELAEGGEA